METRFDQDRADHAVDFFEKLLVHTKDPWARKPFLLAPFQREIITALFGEQMYDPDDEAWGRRYNLAWLEMARKNGKSELMAGIALLLTGGDDEEGAEVYGVAKDRDQASLVFKVARRMVELSPFLSKHFKIYPTNKRIVYPKTDSFYSVIAADALGNLGQNPHGILFDEVIAQPNGELWDAMKTGFGTRRQPLMVAATTAGDDTADFAEGEHEFSMRVAEDQSLDPRRYVYIRNLPREADWKDESRWGEANPALGIFLRPQVLRDELTSASNNPREERRFRMFRLNQWQSGGTDGWVGAEHWGIGGNVGMIPREKLVGKACWGGLVAASASDLAAACWVFANPEGPGVWALWDYWLPRERVADLERRTSGRSIAWVADGGPITVTEGNELDIPTIVQRVRDVATEHDLRELAYFAGNALGIVQPVNEEKITETVSISANTHGSSLLDWERLLSLGQFNHAGNPVSSWQLAHVRTRETVGGTPRIDIRGSSENVYGIVAAELAMRRHLVAEKPRKSAYANRGVVSV